MSHNDNNPQRAASRHKPALIAIAVALLAAFLAFMVFRPGMDTQNDGIATTPPPGETPITNAEGIDGNTSPPVSASGLPGPSVDEGATPSDSN